MKYKAGDRVKIKSLDWYNKNKSETGFITFNYVNFMPEMSRYCSEILTINRVVEGFEQYLMSECEFLWTDEMIEGLAEEKIKPKFKVGDRVITDTNMKGKIIEVVEEGWYRVEFEPHNSIPQPNGVVPEESMSLVKEEIKPKFKVGDKITNGKATLTILSLLSDRYVVEDTFGECGTLYFKFMDNWKLAEVETSIKLTGKAIKNNEMVVSIDEYTLPEGYIFKDENGNVINAQKIVLEKKKKEYPKTYTECCTVLHFHYDHYLTYDDENDINPTKEEEEFIDIMDAFSRLIVCRNAYWKIYGDEMGLGKPWEPIWDYNQPDKYILINVRNSIHKDYRSLESAILAFPTPEMRDAFKENFDPDIEICKELL